MPESRGSPKKKRQLPFTCRIRSLTPEAFWPNRAHRVAEILPFALVKRVEEEVVRVEVLNRERFIRLMKSLVFRLFGRIGGVTFPDVAVLERENPRVPWLPPTQARKPTRSI